MEEEIDLRPYIETLVKNWKWILGVPLVGAIIAFTILSLTPKQYSATAIVSPMEEESIPVLEPGLALNSEVINNLRLQLSTNSTSPAMLEDSLTVELGSDGRSLHLTATMSDPELATEISNAWADTFTQMANKMHEDRKNEQVALIEDQLTVARDSLSEAEATLEAYQSINQTQIISNTLEVYLKNHLDYLSLQESTKQLLENAQSLRTQIFEHPSQENSYADQLTYLQLQLQTYDNDPGLPIILEINTQEILTTVDKSEQIEALDSLISSLELKLERIKESIVDIETEILRLQQESYVAVNEFSRLQQDVNAAQQVHSTIASQSIDEIVSSQGSKDVFQIVSQASVPFQANDKNNLLVVGGSFLVGLFLSISTVFVVVWYKNLNFS